MDREFLAPYLFTYDRVYADGNCYYYSLCKLFNTTPQEIRDLVVELLEERFTQEEKDGFKQTWEDPIIENGLPPLTWEQYMKSIREFAYAGRHSIEFTVLAEALNITIHMWERTSDNGFAVIIILLSVLLNM